MPYPSVQLPSCHQPTRTATSTGCKRLTALLLSTVLSSPLSYVMEPEEPALQCREANLNLLAIGSLA